MARWRRCSCGSGITIVDDFAYVVGSFGLAVVNISDCWTQSLHGLDPSNPRNGIAIVGRGNTTHTETGTWWYRNSTDLIIGYGLTVVNISDPSTPRITGWVHDEDYDVDVLSDFPYFNSLAANIAILGDYAYIAFDNAVKFLDVSDRSRPHLFSDCGHPSGGAQFGVLTPTPPWNTGMAVVGNHACFAFYSWTCFTNVSKYHRRPLK